VVGVGADPGEGERRARQPALRRGEPARLEPRGQQLRRDRAPGTYEGGVSGVVEGGHHVTHGRVAPDAVVAGLEGGPAAEAHVVPEDAGIGDHPLVSQQLGDVSGGGSVGDGESELLARLASGVDLALDPQCGAGQSEDHHGEQHTEDHQPPTGPALVPVLGGRPPVVLVE